MSELVIDKSNFAQYFFDVRHHRPKTGQVMAKFSAVALFGDGPDKRDLIKVLRRDKAKAAAQVMQKIHCAREPDSYRVCREICEDLISGMTDDQVAKKEYEYVLEVCYYTQKEYVPKGDPHWETIDVLKYDTETKTFQSSFDIKAPKQQSLSVEEAATLEPVENHIPPEQKENWDELMEGLENWGKNDQGSAK